MTWVRIEDSFSEHPKVQKVGPLGMAMFVAGLCYCNRNLTDGFIPEGIALTLLPVPQPKKLIHKLVDADLWAFWPGGYMIHDFDYYQPSKAQVLADRARNAERQGRYRDRHPPPRDTPRNGVTDSVTDSVSSTITNAGPVPGTSPENKSLSSLASSLATGNPPEAIDSFRAKLASELASRFQNFQTGDGA